MKTKNPIKEKDFGLFKAIPLGTWTACIYPKKGVSVTALEVLLHNLVDYDTTYITVVDEKYLHYHLNYIRNNYRAEIACTTRDEVREWLLNNYGRPFILTSVTTSNKDDTFWRVLHGIPV